MLLKHIINKHQTRHIVAGLTLIEMMLVVTIIAVATLAGLKILKNRTQINAINTVVTQMQSVAQGVITYYMTNKNKWPTTSTSPSSLESLANTNTQYFSLSQQSLCSPFPGTTYNSYCKNFAEIQGEAVVTNGMNAGYYNLVLVTDSASSALAIAGKLPNAVANGNTITMSVTPPAQYFNWDPYKGWIWSAGVVSFTQYTGSHDPADTILSGSPNSYNDGELSAINIPTCPSGFEGHVMFFPERYQSDGNVEGGTINSTWGVHMAGVLCNSKDQCDTSDEGNKNDDYTDPSDSTNHIATTSSQSLIFKASGTDSHNNSIYAMTLGDNPDTSNTSVQHLAYFMAFCLPVGHWGTNYINSAWPQDGSCSTTWLQFLSYYGNPSPQCLIDSNGFNYDIVGTPDGY